MFQTRLTVYVLLQLLITFTVSSLAWCFRNCCIVNFVDALACHERSGWEVQDFHRRINLNATDVFDSEGHDAAFTYRIVVAEEIFRGSRQKLSIALHAARFFYALSHVKKVLLLFWNVMFHKYRRAMKRCNIEGGFALNKLIKILLRTFQVSQDVLTLFIALGDDNRRLCNI